MKRMLKNPLSIVLAVLALVAVVLGVSWMSGCDTAPKSPPGSTLPKPTDPVGTDPTPPPPDVGADCHSKIQSMKSAVAIAKISAALLVSKDSKYGPAVKLALAAIDGALAEAESQCDGGTVNGWAIALAAFDKAFAQLVVAGDELHAATMPNDIQPPPPYAVSLDEFNAQAFEKEMEWQ